jgi:hypothetical protein
MKRRSKTKLGRKTLLKAALQKQLCDLLAAGNTIKTCCDVCGIARSTFHDWIQRGENGEEKFADFSEAVSRARGRAKTKLVKVLVDAAPLDWRSAAWLLERGWPNEYGRTWREPTTPDEANENDATSVTVVIRSDKSREELLNFPVKNPALHPAEADDVDDAGESFWSLRRRGVV